jgi:hypothetical protein
MKDSLNNVLTKNGVQIPSGTSAYHALDAECKKGPNECKRLLSAIGGNSAANAKLDAEGKATFPALAAGTYYLFGAIQYNKQPMLVDLKIDLKPGANSVTVTERNATPIN